MKYEYQIILLEPDMLRGERINIGVLIYKNGMADIRMPVSLPKLRAIDPAFTPLAIEKAKATLAELASVDIKLFKDISQNLGSLHTSTIGWFAAKSEKEYEEQVKYILVNRIHAPVRKTKRVGVSRLVGSLKKEFKAKGFLSESIDDIDKHRIIPGFTISEEEGLKADFAYKNGVFHVTTVADLRAKSSTLTQKQGRGALKAITMLKGKEKLGGKAYAVYAATQSEERLVQPVISMLDEFSDGNIYNYMSSSDMTSYHNIVADHLNHPAMH